VTTRLLRRLLNDEGAAEKRQQREIELIMIDKEKSTKDKTLITVRKKRIYLSGGIDLPYYAFTSFADEGLGTSEFLNCKKVCSLAPAASH
jgi:hypothetical protein